MVVDELVLRGGQRRHRAGHERLAVAVGPHQLRAYAVELQLRLAEMPHLRRIAFRIQGTQAGDGAIRDPQPFPRGCRRGLLDLDEIALRRGEQTQDVVGQRHMDEVAFGEVVDSARDGVSVHATDSSMVLPRTAPVLRQ